MFQQPIPLWFRRGDAVQEKFPGPGRLMCVQRSDTPSHLTIRAAATDAEREACYRLRYDVYVAEQGKTYSCADHREGRLTDSQDSFSTVLLAEDADARIIGTVRVGFGRNPLVLAAYERKFGLARFSRWAPATFSFASRLAIRAEYRRTVAFKELVSAAYQVGSAGAIVLSFSSCRPHLQPLFSRLGYVACGLPFDEDGGGRQQPLVLVVGDRHHLARVRSPFHALSGNRPADQQTMRQLIEAGLVLPSAKEMSCP